MKLSWKMVGAVATVGLVGVACGSTDESAFDEKGEETIYPPGYDAGFDLEGGAAARDAGDLYANDPLPKWCGPDGGGSAPPVITGTAECPSDKNKPGCPCATPGEQAACWTGLRTNRSLGVCKDGVTTCIQRREIASTWGPCEGQVLPTQGATEGKAACKCFSEGQWKIANLVPCGFELTQNGNATFYAYSSTPGAGRPECPHATPTPPELPAGTWSDDTLEVDCEGRFKLCYELKAGNADAPTAGDCSVAKVCVEGDYPKADVETPFPPLPSWLAQDGVCARKFFDEGGYGEMTVVGTSVLCDAIDDGSGGAYVFNRVKYCPADCAANDPRPECRNCQAGGSGIF